MFRANKTPGKDEEDRFGGFVFFEPKHAADAESVPLPSLMTLGPGPQWHETRVGLRAVNPS